MNTKSVAELATEKELELADLVRTTGLVEERVLAILLGRWTPSPDERSKIADALDVPVDGITWGHRTPIQHIYGHGPG